MLLITRNLTHRCRNSANLSYAGKNCDKFAEYFIQTTFRVHESVDEPTARKFSDTIYLKCSVDLRSNETNNWYGYELRKFLRMGFTRVVVMLIIPVKRRTFFDLVYQPRVKM